MFNINPLAAMQGMGSTSPMMDMGLGGALGTPTAMGAPNVAIAQLAQMVDSLAMTPGSGDEMGGAGGQGGNPLIESLLAEIQQLQQELVQEMQSGQDPTQTEGQLNQDVQELQNLLGGSGAASNGGSPIAGGGGGGSAPMDAGGGGGGGTGGAGDSGGGGGTGGGPVAPIQATGAGGQAVQIAQSQMGKDAQNISLPGYSAAGGATNDCADFVSSCIADAGRFHKSSGDVNVVQFQKDLVSQGYQPVARSQAQPGDVAIILGGGVQHTELVAAPGATAAIGSNGTSQERVSTDNLNWATGVTYYHLNSTPSGH